MKRIIILLLILSTRESFGQKALMIQVTNVKSADGQVVLQLFRENDDMPKQPFMKVVAAIENQAAVFYVDVSYGDYAAIVFHDENANNILDHRLGFPNERMGFSNSWKLSLFSGMPSFQKLRFRFDDQHARYIIPVD